MKQFISSILLKLSKKLHTEDQTSPVFSDKIEEMAEAEKEEVRGVSRGEAPKRGGAAQYREELSRAERRGRSDAIAI